ncbi:hypothetical protein [Paenibacillus sp. FSL H3-0457]|uniref:hypothetical protein n=1 Tax=Paenibacillus sp. FSL H3-0457 TaxID=2921430 RepID=UPI0030EF951B
MNEFVQFTIEQWREKRDKAFCTHNLNLEEVYAKGEFDSLPAECLIAICYVDAFACVQAKIEESK